MKQEGKAALPGKTPHKEANPKTLPGGRQGGQDRQAGGVHQKGGTHLLEGACTIHAYTTGCSHSQRPPDQHFSNLIVHEPPGNPAK